MSISSTLEQEPHLDQSWVHLMIAARKMGITKSEIREFLQKNSSEEEEYGE